MNDVAFRRRIKINVVEALTGFHRQTIWRKYKFSDFPQPHYLSHERSWYLDEVEAWCQRQIAKHNSPKVA